MNIPERFADLIEKPVTALFSSIGPDGAPQCTPVWFRSNGTHLLISLMRSRQKYRNIIREPRVALTLVDPLTSVRYLEVRGIVDAVTDDPDYAFVDGLADRYLGLARYPLHQPGDERVIVHIAPTHTTSQG